MPNWLQIDQILNRSQTSVFEKIIEDKKCVTYKPMLKCFQSKSSVETEDTVGKNLDLIFSRM